MIIIKYLIDIYLKYDFDFQKLQIHNKIKEFLLQQLGNPSRGTANCYRYMYIQNSGSKI